MAVREFNGTTDKLSVAAGIMTGATHGTFAILCKIDDVADVRTAYAVNTSADAFKVAPIQIENGNRITWDSCANSMTNPTGVWCLIIVRKATGSATPRYSLYNFNTDLWTHANDSSGTHANFTAIVATDTIEFHTVADSEHFDGRVAVMASWNNAVHWTADASGDTAIEAAGLEVKLENWYKEAPTTLWKYNQDPLSNVFDIFSDTAHQVSVTGTTVITGDDPPGFTFSPFDTGFLDQEQADEYLLEDGSFLGLESLVAGATFAPPFDHPIRRNMPLLVR